MVILTCIMIALVAGPLSAVATTAAVGQVAYSIFVDAGVAPICAIVAFMLCISTEGASPPSSSPIFISCGLAEVKDPKVIFRPLITDYVLPLLGVAVLVAYGSCQLSTDCLKGELLYENFGKKCWNCYVLFLPSYFLELLLSWFWGRQRASSLLMERSGPFL